MVLSLRVWEFFRAPQILSHPRATDISLHDKTYLRGLNITVTDDMDDLTGAPSKIFQKLTSLEVQGDCCWTIFTEALFQGESKRFSPGASKSASDMGAVFR